MAAGRLVAMARLSRGKAVGNGKAELAAEGQEVTKPYPEYRI